MALPKNWYVLIGLTFFVIIYIFYEQDLFSYYYNQSLLFTKSNLGNKLLPSKQACNFPRLNPFDPTILKYITTKDTEIVNCTQNDKKKEFPLLFITDFNTNLIQLKNPAKFGLFNCCWRPFVRKRENNMK